MTESREQQIDRVVIPSKFDELKGIVDKTEQIGHKLHLSREEIDNLSIAVSEIVSNAICHGNKMDPVKKVIIEFKYSPEEISIYVKDEGNGFDLEKLPNPLTPKNLMKDTGRGIFLLKNLMTEVNYNFTQTGTEVTIKKIFDNKVKNTP